MRILVDTNILFSALVFPRSKPAQALLYIADKHEIVLCDRNIVELRDILGRKAPQYLPDAEVLLAEMSYELIPAVDHAEKLIRDAKDQPILNAAIVSDVDIILTGDKDFLSLDMEHLKCMTVAQFLEIEGVNLYDVSAFHFVYDFTDRRKYLCLFFDFHIPIGLLSKLPFL